MRFLHLLTVLSTLLWGGFATDNGLQTAVTWDPYSLTVNGSRVFILLVVRNMLLTEILTSFSSGEVHYQRMPVPEMWLDIFHKFKANGLNTIRYVTSSSEEFV